MFLFLFPYYIITRVSITVFLSFPEGTHRRYGEFPLIYCTTLFAQLELANASGLARKANPIPII